MNDNNNNTFTLDETGLRNAWADTPISEWADALIDAANQRMSGRHHGDLPRWRAALGSLPELPVSRIELDHEAGVAVLTDADIAADKAAADDDQSSTDAAAHSATQSIESELLNDTAHAYPELVSALQGLKPWRKGPYRIADVTINTEWRSDWKWNRVYPHITPLQNRTVLDVGCGNGYHMWRMRAQGASSVLGIDPGVLFMLQFQALQHYINDKAVSILPLTMETLPTNMHSFDTVFSMGVLYHRKEPRAHLAELRQAMVPGGELVLETLVALGEDESELNIEERYARMRNIWSLPSVPLLAKWMKDAGFKNIRCVSVDITSQLEQRTTDWMPYESLAESLDPENKALTVEGLPRPRRAVMIADAPQN